MEQQYDIASKQLLAKSLNALLDTHYTDLKALSGELPTTTAPRADGIFEAKDEKGEKIIIHAELQTENDAKMLERMFKYAALLYEKNKVPVKQVVIFLGREKVSMKNKLKMPDFVYQYQLISLIKVPYQKLLQYEQPETDIFALLANLQGVDPEHLAGSIFQRWQKSIKSQTELLKYCQNLEILAQKRKFALIISKLIDNMLTLDITQSSFYKKGIEKGIEKGVEKTVIAMYLKGYPLKEMAEITQLKQSHILEILDKYNMENSKK